MYNIFQSYSRLLSPLALPRNPVLSIAPSFKNKTEVQPLSPNSAWGLVPDHGSSLKDHIPKENWLLLPLHSPAARSSVGSWGWVILHRSTVHAEMLTGFIWSRLSFLLWVHECRGLVTSGHCFPITPWLLEYLSPFPFVLWALSHSVLHSCQYSCQSLY